MCPPVAHGFSLAGTKKSQRTAPEQRPSEKDGRRRHGLVVLIASEFLGRGESPQLGSVVMQSFLHTLNGLLTAPETIIFINSGVKLVCEGCQTVEDLRRLSEGGVELLACGTCLNYFNLTDKVAVGQVSNMPTIAETLMQAEKVVSI